jgi:uncharacterized protein YegP (UPF0339 family)
VKTVANFWIVCPGVSTPDATIPMNYRRVSPGKRALGHAAEGKEETTLAQEFKIKKNSSSQYWWRLQAANNRVIADSGETYNRKSDCRSMLEWIKANAATIPIVDETGERV